MALVKCPDCGKMVSERATVCPDCGCPAEFYIKDDAKKVEKSVLEEEKLEYKLLQGVVATYKKSDAIYANLYGLYIVSSLNAYDKLLDLYKKSKTIGVAIRQVPEAGAEIIDNVFQKTVEYLYSVGITTTVEQFISGFESKYDFDYEGHVYRVIEKYENILEIQDQQRLSRKLEKAGRGRWQGGGFGLKGAIKGALTASVLNAGSDVLHSFGDSAKASADAKKIESKLSALYNDSDTKRALCGSVELIIMEIFDALACYMAQEGKVNPHKKMYDEHQRADVLYESCMEFEHDQEKLISKLTECILIYPGDPKYYVPIYSLLVEEDNDFEAFIDFWSISGIFDDIDKKKGVNKLKQLETENTISSFGYDENSFQDFSYENTMRILNDYLLYTSKGNDWSSNQDYYKKIKQYFSNINWDNISIDEMFMCIPDSMDMKMGIESILSIMSYTVKDIPTHLYPCLYEDDSDDKKILKLLESDEKVVEYNVIFDLFKSKGYVITNKCIINLKTKNKLLLEGNDKVSYIQGETFELSNSNGSIQFDAIEYQTKYTDAIKRQVAVCIEKIIQFSYTGTIDSKKETQRQSGECENREKETMFCPFCGKEILRTAKFCNFCGKQNNYNK